MNGTLRTETTCGDIHWQNRNSFDLNLRKDTTLCWWWATDPNERLFERENRNYASVMFSSLTIFHSHVFCEPSRVPHIRCFVSVLSNVETTMKSLKIKKYMYAVWPILNTYVYEKYFQVQLKIKFRINENLSICIQCVCLCLLRVWWTQLIDL